MVLHEGLLMNPHEIAIYNETIARYQREEREEKAHREAVAKAELDFWRQKAEWDAEYNSAPVRNCPICSKSFKAMNHNVFTCPDCIKTRRLIDEVLDGEAQQAEKHGKRLSVGDAGSRSAVCSNLGDPDNLHP